MITIYEKPGCTQCTATKIRMDSLGVEYSKVDISKNPEAFEHVISLGYKAAPVVETPNGHWSGYNEDKIDELAA